MTDIQTREPPETDCLTCGNPTLTPKGCTVCGADWSDPFQWGEDPRAGEGGS